MNKLISTYMVLNVIFIILNAAMAGGGGIAVTQLTSSMSASDTTMQVTDTTGFLSNDVLTIDNEYIAYANKTATSFTGLTRGYNLSQPATHSIGKNVMTQDTGLINQALGFNISSTSTSSGAFAVASLGFIFLSRTLINLIIWDFPNIFQGDILLIIRILLIACGVGFAIFIILNYIIPALNINR